MHLEAFNHVKNISLFLIGSNKYGYYFARTKFLQNFAFDNQLSCDVAKSRLRLWQVVCELETKFRFVIPGNNMISVQ